MTSVTLLDTGVANLASLEATFARLNVTTIRASTPDAVEQADALVLPGVGAFGAAMERLNSLDVVGAIRARIDADRPTLCVCLCMQLLCESSADSPGVRGLGVLPCRVERLVGPRRTHFGWSRLDVSDGPSIAPGFAYFAHSFAIRDVPTGWSPTYATFGERFVASLARGNVLACQFHPELSGAWGSTLLARWLERSSAFLEDARCSR